MNHHLFKDKIKEVTQVRDMLQSEVNRAMQTNESSFSVRLPVFMWNLILDILTAKEAMMKGKLEQKGPFTITAWKTGRNQIFRIEDARTAGLAIRRAKELSKDSRVERAEISCVEGLLRGTAYNGQFKEPGKTKASLNV